MEIPLTLPTMYQEEIIQQNKVITHSPNGKCFEKQDRVDYEYLVSETFYTKKTI